MGVQEEGKTPTLRLVVRLRVEFGEGIAELGFGRHDALAAKVGHLGDLVGKHLLDRLGLEDLLARLGVGAVVEQRRDDLAVLGRFGEAAGAALVEGAVDVFLRRHHQRPAIEVPVRVYHQCSICVRDTVSWNLDMVAGCKCDGQSRASSPVGTHQERERACSTGSSSFPQWGTC